MRARIPASSGLFALNREISVCVRLRGGAERTRTACQPRSRYRYRTDLRPGPSGGFSAIKCRWIAEEPPRKDWQSAAKGAVLSEIPGA